MNLTMSVTQKLERRSYLRRKEVKDEVSNGIICDAHYGDLYLINNIT